MDNLEQYEIISPVNKEEQPKGNIFIKPVIILAKGGSLKTVLDARYLNSLTDESKCNWSIELIQVILTKINGQFYTTADMNSSYNQKPHANLIYKNNSLLATNITIFIRLFRGISIGAAAFSALMSKMFRPLILSKNDVTYLDEFFIQSSTKHEMFRIFDQYHQIFLKKNLKAAPDKSHFLLPVLKFLVK